MTDTATATRPPAKPIRRSTPTRSTAKHHLEPNPFEKSFSSGPTSSESVDRRSDFKNDPKAANLSTPPLNTRVGAAYRDRTYSASKNQTSPSANNESGSTPKPLLPPVASMTSPAGETSQYPWSAGLTSSLRSGPLSPAMLAGPQSSHFDPNSFRTGFTPDLSNFKTGLTPLGGGMSFPPPSPNTAAFLAAMVNNTSAPSTSAATITPNTLSALTNAAAGSVDPANNAAAGALSTQPQTFGSKPQDAHNTFDLAFSRTFGGERGAEAKAGSKLKAEVKSEQDRGASQSISPEMVTKPLAGANGDQQNAVSGLFMLSRAHQELSKRDGANAGGAHAANASTSLYESTNKPSNNKKAAANTKSKSDEKPNGANKRKKSGSAEEGGAASSSSAPKAAKTTKGKKGTATAAAGAVAGLDANHQTGKDGPIADHSFRSDGHTADDDGWDSEGRDDQDDHDDNGNDKGNMDEKRKNFLERNRQAALKCRQRKKAWLASLQAKVEYLQNDNENLQNTVSALRNENMFLKSQLVQATGGAPPPGMPMGMPMGLPMAPPSHPADPHHTMGPGSMGIPASMAPHPAYMHPGASGPPISQGPGTYPTHGVPRPNHMAPGYMDPVHRGGRPRSEGDALVGAADIKMTDQPLHGAKHEREWSSSSEVSRQASVAPSGAATIKV